MARAPPSLTHRELESQFGYKVNYAFYDNIHMRCFYPSLRPVSNSNDTRIREDYEAYKNRRFGKDYDTGMVENLPKLGEVQTIRDNGDTITLSRRSLDVSYNFTVEIHYNCGFDLSLLVTNDQASRVLSVAKLRPSIAYGVYSMFLNLPKEIRIRIYTLALPKGNWELKHMNNFTEHNFTGGMGDPGGFYFPLSKTLSVLRVNRQIRQEALPFAYRKTIFIFNDMDDFVKLLIAIGKIGRDNIESLSLTWESGADCEDKWHNCLDAEDPLLTLPTLHAVKAVQLLKQCNRLTYLRLCFDRELISNVSSEAYEADPGMQELCSIRRIRRVEFVGLDYEPLEQRGLGKWLKEKMKPYEEGKDNQKEFRKQLCR